MEAWQTERKEDGERQPKSASFLLCLSMFVKAVLYNFLNGTSLQQPGRPARNKPGSFGFIFEAGKDENPKAKGNVTSWMSSGSLENIQYCCEHLSTKRVVLRATPSAES